LTHAVDYFTYFRNLVKSRDLIGLARHEKGTVYFAHGFNHIPGVFSSLVVDEAFFSSLDPAIL
jgi:hypothetical protein